eukprot:10106162-Karenia_brevis.AAC.1
MDSGTIVVSKRLLASIVVFSPKRKKHVSAKYAANYCQSQHMNTNNGTIVFSEALPAMLVVIQSAPIRNVGR